MRILWSGHRDPASSSRQPFLITVKSIDLPAPTSMRMDRRSTSIPGELSTEQDVLALMLDMFNDTEVTWEHFSEYGSPKDDASRRDRGSSIRA